MSAADNIALPVWALNDQGHALVEQIIAERPDHYVTRGQWIEGGGVKVFRGPLAGRLRRMHDDWLDREQAELDAQFNVTRIWDQAASDALHRTEDGNQLIERVLRETERVVPFTRMSIKELPDGRHQVAA